VSDACPSCRFDSGHFGLSLFPVSVEIRDSHFTQGNPKSTAVEVRVPKIIARVSLWKFFTGHIHISHLSIFSPTFVVTEGDFKAPSERSEKARGGSYWKTIFLERTELYQGDFKYIRNYGARSAMIHLNNIEASVGPWGTTPEAQVSVTHARAQGLLENSGRFVLDVKVPLLSEVPQVDIDLQVEGLLVSKLNSYFEVSDGIKLDGSLVQAVSTSKIRGTALTGSVRVLYFGLDLKFQKTNERGALAALISNFIKSSKLVSSNMETRPQERVRDVRIQRKASETMIQFILRGMKIGVFDIVI
jgi:hypothetical protein